MELPAPYDRLSRDERRAAREQYAREQGGRCWFCRDPLAEESPYQKNGTKVNWRRFPPEFLRYPVHLHHDHATGMTIGAVHAYCNAVSFDYVESPVGDQPPLVPAPGSQRQPAPAHRLWFLGRRA